MYDPRNSGVRRKFSGKVAKVNAELINKKDAKALVEKVANGALVLRKPESFPTRDVRSLQTH